MMRDFDIGVAPVTHYDPKFTRRFWTVALAALVVLVAAFAVIV